MEEARRIGHTLVRAHIAACVNLIPGMRSIYQWQGEIREDAEVVVIAKTRGERMADVIEAVAGIHGYDCPCIVAVPMVAGHQPFLDWIKHETGG